MYVTPKVHPAQTLEKSGPVFVIKVNVLAKRITMSQANVRELAQ